MINYEEWLPKPKYPSIPLGISGLPVTDVWVDDYIIRGCPYGKSEEKWTREQVLEYGRNLCIFYEAQLETTRALYETSM